MRWFGALLLVASCGIIAAAQQTRGAAQEPPAVTFRTETNFVEVHAIVTDQRGAFVRGLTRDDFEIDEDGIRQKPAAFSLVDLPIEKRFVPAASPGPIDADVLATSRSFEGRLYILLFDDLHTSLTRSAQTRELAKQFIQRYLGPKDLAAVVYTSDRQQSGQDLTGNQRLLLASIDKFIGQKLPSAGVEKLAAHVQQTQQDQLTTDPGEPDISGVVSRNSRTPERLDAARGIDDPDDLERGLRAIRMLDAVKNVANWLGDVQGRRKALVLFSEGIDYDIYQPFSAGGQASSIIASTQEAIAAAQRANVNIYPIDPRGMSQFGEMIDVNEKSDYPQLEYGTFRGFLHELLLAQESLMTLADQTGGIAIVNAGDIAGGLGRIILDNSRYYLLGYYSDSKRWGRKFLRIQVRTNRPGLQVRARRGFMPPDAARAASRDREIDVKAGTSPALKAALTRPLPIGELPLRVFAASVRGTGSNPAVLVSLEIDGSALKFEERDGRSNESVEVSIVAIDDRGRVQGGDRQMFNLRLMPDTRARIRSNWNPPPVTARHSAGAISDTRRRTRVDRRRPCRAALRHRGA
jgi:VWFA-related protein